jgi:peptidoglycan hydrolase-like protein with peptidoglycan-binding domain
VLAGLAVVAAAIVLVVIDPFAGGGTPSGTSDNQYATSLARVSRRSLSSQTTVSGTLGYAGDSTIRIPVGSPPDAVTQAEQSVQGDEGMLATAHASLASDSAALAQARANASAAEQQETIECAGDHAAPSAGQGGTSGACASGAQAITSDQQAVTQAAAKVAGDQASLSGAERSLAGAQAALASLRATATLYGADSTFTAVPSAGAIVRRGQRLYAIDGEPVLLLYGSTVASRAFISGMSSGPDVAELNANLDALGYGHGLHGDAFTASTAAAIRALQTAHRMNATGVLQLGSVVFERSAVRVTSLAPTLGVGSPVQAGPALTVSSTSRQVTIALDAAEEGQVVVGDPVIITLPDNSTTPGRISYVSPVASSQGGSTTITVDAVPSDPAATGALDQAPVNVAITTASVHGALVVQVAALLALSGGGYAIEEVARDGVHHLLPVSTGLFDDADGLVQISGAGVAAGARVVVPGS